jgi:diguanylate cyclase (GGDEF)-like protein
MNRWQQSKSLKMRIIDTIALFWIICVLPGISSAATDAEPTLADRIEMIDWSDPERAIHHIDAAAPDSGTDANVQMLEVRGMVYADVLRTSDVDATIVRLQGIARQGSQSALRAVHYVRAYSLFEQGLYSAASTELSNVDIEAIGPTNEQYRFLLLRGNSLRIQRQAEAALPFIEKSLALAEQFHDELRTLRALLALTRLQIDSGHFEAALAQLATARRLASEFGDEASLAESDSYESLIAQQRGDHTSERRASLSALEHAKRSGSNKALLHALIDLSDSYLQTRQFKESLKYSKQALPIASKWPKNEGDDIAIFNEAIAYVGVGNVKRGQELAESAIADVLASGDHSATAELLREYADVLEQSGYLVMAIDAYRRHDELSEKVMSNNRQLAFELSAKLDDIRRTRDLELMRRDIALKAAEARGQRMQRQLMMALALFITGICAALTWAFLRVRKANGRLRFISERDALTGLRNRQYFNEHVLTANSASPVHCCVLVADIDHFKRINDTFGHPAGDVVLTTLSRRLALVLRETDKLVRWGGEEFLAVLDAISPADAHLTIERLLQTVRQEPVVWNGQTISCSISIGYACFPLRGTTPVSSLETAITLVDKALYEAKRGGRDRACLITEWNPADNADSTLPTAPFDPASADYQIQFVEMGVAA